MRVCQVTQFSMVDGTSSSDDHTGCGVVVLNVGFQVIAAQGSDVFLGSQDGPSQSSSLKSSSMKVVQYQLLLLFIDFRHFSQDNIAFTFDCSFFQLAVEKDIREDFDSSANIVLENLGKVDRLLTRSVGITTVLCVL